MDVVDTGLATTKAREAWMNVLTDLSSLRSVIVTHLHPDHVGLAGWMIRRSDATMMMSRTEYLQCRMLAADTGRDAPEAALSFYRHVGWTDEEVAHYVSRFGRFGSAISTLPDAYRRLKDKDLVRIGQLDWEVIVGSGHSPEHACLYQPDINVFISGDQVLPGITPNVSVWPTEPEADPLGDFLQSCHTLLERVPHDALVLPAHGLPFRGLHTRLHQLLDHHADHLQTIGKATDERSLKMRDLFPMLFRREITMDVLSMASGEAMAHLNHAVHHKTLVRSVEEGVWTFSSPS